MKVNKPEVALFIYKSIDEALLKIIKDLAEKYLKPLKNKPWYKLALNKYQEWTKLFLNILKNQAVKYSDFIKDKEIFKKNLKADEKKYRTEEYLDELYNLVVVDNIKDVLIDMGKDFETELQLAYARQNKQLIIEAAKFTSKDIGFKFNFNQFNKLTRDYLEEKSIKWARQVQETTEKSIKKILVRGFEEGLGSYDIAEHIQADTNFSYRRSEAIARTEIISSCNYADNAMYAIDENVIGKEWSSTGDSRTRKSHSYADGQKVKKDKPFTIGAHKLMHPGDNSLGAPAKEIINCRCTTLPVFKGESLK